jgi:signal transduction histidine kinase
MVMTMTDSTAHKLARIRQIKDAADAQDLEALLDVAKALHSTLDVGQLLGLVVEKAVALTRADRGCLVTVEEQGGYQVKIARDRDGGALPPETFRPSRSVLDAVIRQKSALVENDVADTELGAVASIQELSIRMVLCAPLFVDGKIAGLIYVDSVASGEGFSERRLRTLDALAGQAAVAWQQANLFAEIRDLYEKTTILDAGKMDFIHIASHELRTPLALIRGYVDMLGYLMAGGEYARVRELLGSVSSGVARLTEIVNTMLMATQLDQGEFSVKKSPYPLRGLLEQVIESWRPAADERGLGLGVVFEGADDDQVVGEIDPVNLEIALGHLVQNAIKFTPDGGTITVRLTRATDALQVEVIDTGIGIEPRYCQVIFEKFYRIGEVRLHSTGKTKFNGAGPGLGLFLARGIVEAHGGRIWVESTGPHWGSAGDGAGSKFVVRLPERSQP